MAAEPPLPHEKTVAPRVYASTSSATARSSSAASIVSAALFASAKYSVQYVDGMTYGFVGNASADVRAVLREVGRDVLVDELDVVDAVEPAGDAGLVAHDGDGDAGSVERRDGLGGAVDEPHIGHGADVPPVDDDGAVAIEEDPGA